MINLRVCVDYGVDLEHWTSAYHFGAFVAIHGCLDVGGQLFAVLQVHGWEIE